MSLAIISPLCGRKIYVRCTHCLRLTRSTEDKGALCKQLFQHPLKPLRVSVLRKITLRVLRVSPKARALATNLCARDANGTQRRKGRRGRRAVTQQIH